MDAEKRIEDNTDPLKDLFTTLGPHFGSGTTTSRSSSESGSAANAQADELIKSIQQSVNPDNLAQLVQGILLKAKTALGPNIAASLGAGNRTVSDSSLAQIQNEATSRAAAESAQAVLDAQNNAAKLTTSIVNTKLNASKNTTQTQKTGVSPAGKGILALTAAQKARKLFGKNEDPTNSADKISAPEQLGYSPEQLANLSGPEQLAGPGFETSSAAVTDVIPGSGGLGADAPFLDPFFFDSSAPISGDSNSSPVDVSGNSGGSGSDGSDNVIVNVGDGPPDRPGTTFSDPAPPPPGTDNDPETTAPPPDEEIGCFLCWIVCTELHRQGKLPTRWYIPGSRVFAKYDDNIKRGYYFWAIPLSKHLRYFPDSLLSKITTIGCNHRAEFIANRAGIRGARKTFRGFLVIHSLYWACWFLGKILPKRIQFTEESGYGRARN